MTIILLIVIHPSVPALLLLVGLGLAPEARAQSAAPSEPATRFYSTATVRERPLSSATASVTVLDRETITASGARTVADLLRFAPGLDVTSNGPRGGFTTAQIRGGDPNFSLVLLDGVPMNDSTYQVGDAFDLGGPAGLRRRAHRDRPRPLSPRSMARPASPE